MSNVFEMFSKKEGDTILYSTGKDCIGMDIISQSKYMFDSIRSESDSVLRRTGTLYVSIIESLFRDLVLPFKVFKYINYSKSSDGKTVVTVSLIDIENKDNFIEVYISNLSTKGIDKSNIFQITSSSEEGLKLFDKTTHVNKQQIQELLNRMVNLAVINYGGIKMFNDSFSCYTDVDKENILYIGIKPYNLTN